MFAPISKLSIKNSTLLPNAISTCVFFFFDPAPPPLWQTILSSPVFLYVLSGSLICLWLNAASVIIQFILAKFSSSLGHGGCDSPGTKCPAFVVNPIGPGFASKLLLNSFGCIEANKLPSFAEFVKPSIFPKASSKPSTLS